MNTIQHHLTDETLQEYSAGLLNAPMETLIACHLTVCPHCRARSEFADAVGGASLTAEECSVVHATVDDIFNLDQARPKQALSKKNKVVAQLGVPSPLARLLPGPISDLPWKTMGPGMKQFSLSNSSRKDGVFKLLSIEPGARMSKHAHTNRELTFIVNGSYTDEFGQFNTGDISDLGTGHSHMPSVIGDAPCIALTATDAPVKMESIIGKIFQPFVGF